MKEIYRAENLKEIILNSAEKYGDKEAFTLKIIKGEKRSKKVTYEDITYSQFKDDIYSLGTLLLNENLLSKRCAFIGKNSYEWFTSYISVLLGGGTVVPLDKGLPYDEIKLSIERSESKVIFFDKANEAVIEQIMKENTNQDLKAVSLERESEHETFYDLLRKGRALRNQGELGYDDIEIDNDKVSILLFTSGTTSMSKIVMLTQRNVATNIAAAVNVEPFYPSDVNMAFLPYHHTFGSTGQWVMIASGAKTVYCDGLKYIQQNMVEYKVSVFVAVPLLIESIYKKIINQAEKQGKLGQLRFMTKVCNGLLKVGIDIRRKVFKGILDKLGGEIRFIISGAAAIDPEALKGFTDLGIMTVQGYGLTETSPILTAENPDNMKLGSVGIAFPDIQVKIDNPDNEGVGEVIAKGPNIMKGYYKNEEETNAVIKDGWFYTGDLGYIDNDGFLFLRGRKKNVIVLKNGKNIYPEELEITYANLPYVKENVVLGIPNKEDERDLILYLKIVYDNEYFDCSKEEIEAIIKKDVDKINDTLPKYKQIRRIIITDEEMIKTTSGKVKRFEEIKTIQS